MFAVWRAGGAGAAIELASHALARNDHHRPQVSEQLARLRAAAPLEPPAERPPALDLELVGALVDRYRYHEARCVLRAAGLTEGSGRRLAALLDEALAAFPNEADPSFDAVLHLVRAGQAPSALRALEEVDREAVAPADWLTARVRALSALVRGTWREGPALVEDVTRETVVARIRARDLEGALEAARAAGAKELAAVLRRLLDATEGVFTDASHPDTSDPETVPMEGHRLCEFQTRMGVLDQADRGYRAILRASPDDERARARLADVIQLREALGEAVQPLPPRARASVDGLKKNAPRAAGGWSAGGEAPRAYERFGESAAEESTDVLEASQEAELLLKLGKAEQALDMYRILAILHPKQQAYRKRIAEIEALIAQRMTGAVAEVTMRHDLSELRRRAVPTKPNVRLPEMDVPRQPVDEDEEWPTLIDVVPELDD